MEGPRFLLAIVLSIAVVIVVNVMFPPTPPPRTGPDSLAIDTLVMEAPDTAAVPGPDHFRMSGVYGGNYRLRCAGPASSGWGIGIAVIPRMQS